MHPKVEPSALSLLHSAGVSDAQLERAVREIGNEDEAQVRLLISIVEGRSSTPQKERALEALIRLAPADYERAYWQRMLEKINLGRLERSGVARVEIAGGKAACAPCQHFLGRVYLVNDRSAAELLPPENCPEIDCSRSCRLAFSAATQFASSNVKPGLP